MRLFVVVLFAVSLLACQSKPKQQNNQQASASHMDNVSLLLTHGKAENQQAPDFTWYDKDGKQVSFLEISKGKPVLLNFWATWCGPCVKEIPDLVALSEEFAAKGALVIGISADRDDDALALVSDFTKKYNVKYPIIIDNGDLEEAFGGLQGYPTTFFIDRSGKIVKKLIGMQSKERFAKELNAVF